VLALAQKIAVALVGFCGGAEAGVLAHRPEATAVHGGINAAGVGKLAGIAERVFGIPAGKILIRVETLDGQTGESREFFFALPRRDRLGFCV
jgi:hypothetical protein